MLRLSGGRRRALQWAPPPTRHRGSRVSANGEKPCLLGGKQAGPAPSRQGWRVPRHRFAACGLDRLSPARQGLAKQVRLNRKRNASDSGEGHRPPSEHRSARNGLGYWHPTSRNRRQQVSLRSATTARLSDFRSALPRCFSFDGPHEGAPEWRRKRKRKGIVPPMTTGRAPVSRLTPAFCGLRKLSADSLLASRPNLRPPP